MSTKATFDVLKWIVSKGHTDLCPKYWGDPGECECGLDNARDSVAELLKKGQQPMTTERSGMSLTDRDMLLKVQRWILDHVEAGTHGATRICMDIDAHLSSDAVVSDEDVERVLAAYYGRGIYAKWENFDEFAKSTQRGYMRAALTSFAAKCISASDVGNGWIRAIDEAMIASHIGVAEASDSYEDACSKLNELICWNVMVATDPKLNGWRLLREAGPNDDQEVSLADKHNTYVYEVDFGDEGKGRYIRLGDFNTIVRKLESFDALHAAVPDGYVLVPVEPTEAMRLAANKATMSHRLPRSTIDAVYKAMLAQRDGGK